MKNKYSVVEYSGKKYKVCKDSKDNVFLLDFDTVLPDFSYYKGSAGYFLSSKADSIHRIIMGCNKGDKKHIDHINRITSDNRPENLRLATQSEQNYNKSKKPRKTNLPENCNIKIDDFPTYIHYIKMNKYGSDGIAIEINKRYRKSYISNKTTLLEKFEFAKTELIRLKTEEPQLFEGCYGGELSEQGKILEKEYNEIMEIYNKNFI